MNFRKLSMGVALAATLLASTASAETVRFWYHFDNPENPMADLVAKFEAANPGITIEAENVPWNSYYDTLYTSLVGGNAPDAAMVKLFAQPRLAEMGALEPLGDKIDAWAGSVIGAGLNARSNRTPSAARRSRCCVRPRAYPYAPRWSARVVSRVTSRMLSRTGAAAEGDGR